MEPVQRVQMNIYQSNTYSKNLNWLYLDDEPRAQEAASEGQTVPHTRFCSLSNFFQVAIRSTSPDIKTVFHARP